jgi:hypothetical protein
MAKSIIALLAVASLSAVAEQTDVRNKFVGTWEAKWKEKVICTIRLRSGDPISGETQACSIRVDANGDLLEPETTRPSDGPPAPILNPKLNGEVLTFEEQDGSDVLKFEMRIVSEGKAELRFPGAPVQINPVAFTRK